MKILQVCSLHSLIYDKRLLSKRSFTRYWSLKIWGMRRQWFYTNSDCVTLEDKIRSIYNNEICELFCFFIEWKLVLQWNHFIHNFFVVYLFGKWGRRLQWKPKFKSTFKWLNVELRSCAYFHCLCHESICSKITSIHFSVYPFWSTSHVLFLQYLVLPWRHFIH